MNILDQCRLLRGLYQAPPLFRGDRATCELRGDVIITSISAGRIPCRRCRAIGHRGGSGLLLARDLVRAVRQESAAAVMYWWGAAERVVWGWRRILGVTYTNNEGSHCLVQVSAEARAAAMQAREWTEAERRKARKLGLIEHAQAAYLRNHARTKSELRLLGKLPDAEVAQRIGRTLTAVRLKREKLGLPNPVSQNWTADELALVGRLPDAEIARRTGRSPSAVMWKRLSLGIATATDLRRREA